MRESISASACSALSERPLPSVLSPLIAENIYLCTTIDYLAAIDGVQSYSHFRDKFESPFITPYDPANWRTFKLCVLEVVTRDSTVAAATTAAEAAHKARVSCLPHAQPLILYAAACEEFRSRLVKYNDVKDFDQILLALFLLILVEMMLPDETSAGLLNTESGVLAITIKEYLARDSASPLCLRLMSWLLICHGAARRSGNRGLLSSDLRSLFVAVIEPHHPLPSLQAASNTEADGILLSTLSESLFIYFARTQMLSAEVAELSHYHRSRTTGADQEEVSILMLDIKAQLERLWQDRPALMRHRPEDLYAQFNSTSIVTLFGLLSTLSNLVYHTELVEIGRNLSHEQGITIEAWQHLCEMRQIIEGSSKLHGTHPAFLRALLLVAIESPLGEDSTWAVAEMRKIHDPLCYSEFFANFSEGLADAQRRVGRRVTTRWFSMRTFGLQLPFL
ncbi:hypothetical protein LTR78_005982 [Recurvomyces mirabilis]|uniref:Uncharacterized protein n=1 Tax=Recurvomyces mirabilis TaxID=574656 RepID=A0AAE0WLU1_9PEZI|nr:hypothetical protein LTR78_005982 [Recurvomyces mirabilis]KAK5155207.1 hypothetical protein LTS14_006162 [Recurvomyces mirabilis]